MLQACLVLGILWLTPEVTERYAPSVARYVPPFFLTLLALLSLAYALLVWRTRRVLDWLFPGCAMLLPAWSRREKMGQSVSAWTGVLVSAALFVLWLWKVL